MKSLSHVGQLANLFGMCARRTEVGMKVRGSGSGADLLVRAGSPTRHFGFTRQRGGAPRADQEVRPTSRRDAQATFESAADCQSALPGETHK